MPGNIIDVKDITGPNDFGHDILSYAFVPEDGEPIEIITNEVVEENRYEDLVAKVTAEGFTLSKDIKLKLCKLLGISEFNAK
jgi:hypothetical protein